MASLAGVDCDGGPGPGAIYGLRLLVQKEGRVGMWLTELKKGRWGCCRVAGDVFGGSCWTELAVRGGGVLLRSLDHHGPARDGAAKRCNESGGRDRHRAR